MVCNEVSRRTREESFSRQDALVDDLLQSNTGSKLVFRVCASLKGGGLHLLDEYKGECGIS